MGKLNIAHHKSYHPYRRDNIERVRRDEEEARQKEAQEEGRMMLADSEARMDRLRERAGAVNKPLNKKRKDDDMAQITAGSSMQEALLPTTAGHINFFEDLEHQNVVALALRTTKKSDPAETEKGVPLAPSAKDLKPWYAERTNDGNGDEEVVDEKRKRDTARKAAHDPLTTITHKLASTSSSSHKPFRPRQPPPISSTTKSSEVKARLTRESTERERALELIRRKKREIEGNETPSTTYGGAESGYGDLFNRREVEDARRERERRWDSQGRGWDDDSRGRRNDRDHRRYW